MASVKACVSVRLFLIFISVSVSISVFHCQCLCPLLGLSCIIPIIRSFFFFFVFSAILRKEQSGRRAHAIRSCPCPSLARSTIPMFAPGYRYRATASSSSVFASATHRVEPLPARIRILLPGPTCLAKLTSVALGLIISTRGRLAGSGDRMKGMAECRSLSAQFSGRRFRF